MELCRRDFGGTAQGAVVEDAGRVWRAGPAAGLPERVVRKRTGRAGEGQEYERHVAVLGSALYAA